MARTRKAPPRFPRPNGISGNVMPPPKFVGDCIGIDEVGWGAWAGPIVFAAVAIKQDAVSGVKDSKLIAEEKRYVIAEAIKQVALAWKVVVISPQFIDKNGYDASWDKGASEAVKAIREESQLHIVVDGTRLPTEGKDIEAFPRADYSVYQVAAASIVAKAHRDSLMVAAAHQYPSFRFDKHKGYGTREHQQELKNFGATDFHRKSLRAVSNPDKPLPKEELKFDEKRAKKMAEGLKDLKKNPHATAWELQFVNDINAALEKGKRLSSRQMFFLGAISKRRQK